MNRITASLIAITVAGVTGAVGQVLVLRELLALFYGNELSTAVVFSCWLLWTAVGSGLAGRKAALFSERPALLGALLVSLAPLLPLTVLWIRASRLIWSIPTGEAPTPAVMLCVALTSTVAFCTVSGMLFAAAWSILAGKGGESRAGSRGPASPVTVYVGEAMGAAAGGALYYFVLLPNVSALAASFLLAIPILSAAARIGRSTEREAADSRRTVSKPIVFCFFAILLGLLVYAGFGKSLDSASRKWQWGPRVAEVRDTPFHNLALLRNADQYTFFANGLWLFTLPDPQTAEFAAHPAMLQHPNPRTVLILGGGVSGIVAETLKHPSVESVHYVEPDPEVIEMARRNLSETTEGLRALNDPRVTVFNFDAGSFVRSTPHRYDVALLSAGEPFNAEMNRFYTVEFYERIRKLLNHGGIFSFGTASAPDVVGTSQARFLRSVHATLSAVFKGVTVFPGETARFFASDLPENLVKDPHELVERISARNLDKSLLYFQDYYIFDYLNPGRVAYLKTVLEGGRPSRVNRDLAPTCYLNGLIVWSAQFHPSIEKALLFLSNIEIKHFWIGFGLALAILAPAFRLLRFSYRSAAGANVAIVGAAQIVLEIVLLLAFQIFQGFLYTQLALIIGFFMAGIGVGAAFVAGSSVKGDAARSRLMAVQAGLIVYLTAVLGFLFAVSEYRQAGSTGLGLPSWAISTAFSIMALISGIFGGLHFSLAVKSVEGSDGPCESTGAASLRAGPSFYALDLVGAAAGALIAGLFLLPVYGIVTTTLSLALLCAVGLAILAMCRPAPSPS